MIDCIMRPTDGWEDRQQHPFAKDLQLMFLL